MIRFREPPASSEPAQTSLVVGTDLEDALALFGQQQDCNGCTSAVAASTGTAAGSIDRVRGVFTPLAEAGPVLRPESAPASLLRRSSYWTEIDIDARAQRLSSVRMPTALVGEQRLLAVNDLRESAERRPVIAIGLWALFAHPVVRMGARLGGTRDGLTAEIALAVHPDRYVLIDHDLQLDFTYVLSSTDIVAAELIVLALRAGRARFRGVGPWEDPLVQAATDLKLGANNADDIDIDALVSPTLSSEQQNVAVTAVKRASELIGVDPAA